MRVRLQEFIHMGATFFFIVMILMFITALFFIVASTLCIVVFRCQKKRGKTCKLRWLAIPAVILIVSLIAALIPVGWVAFLRAGNSSAGGEVVEAESGKMVYWGHDENGGGTVEEFTMDGVTYVETIGYGSKDTWRLGEAEANIRFDSSKKLINKLFNTLFAYDDRSTLYPVINDGGFALYTIGSGIYCPEGQAEQVERFYSDLANYDTTNGELGYALYEERTSGADGKREYTYEYDLLTLQEGVFAGICALETGEEEELQMPEKSAALGSAQRPCELSEGFRDATLYIYSKDGAVSQELWLGFLDGQIYNLTQFGAADDESETAVIKGYPLPAGLAEALRASLSAGE